MLFRFQWTIFTCRRRLLAWLNLASQDSWLQTKGLAPVWIFICISKAFWYWNIFPQRVHWNFEAFHPVNATMSATWNKLVGFDSLSPEIKESNSPLTLCMQGNFSPFCTVIVCWRFSKLAFSKNFFQEYNKSAKHFGSRSVCWSWSGSKLFAKVLSRRQMSPLAS